MREYTHTTEVFDDETAAKIRSMSLYWEEVARREDRSPLDYESAQVRRMLDQAGVLMAARFCADRVRLAAPDLLEACESVLRILEPGDDPERWVGVPCKILRAAIAKAKGNQ